MNKFPWIKPIAIRSSDEAHRQASWLELFVDLGFVLAISSTTKIFETGFSLDNLLVYSGVFFSIFWVWNRFTWYATLFDNNDIPFRLSFLASIFCIIGLSASIEEISANNYNHFTFYYFIVECILLYLWSRVWRKPQYRILAKHHLIGYSIGTLLIALSLLVEGKTKLIFWLLAILSEAIGPIVAWYRMRSQIPVHTSHIIERHGLFTIILLGEGVVAIGHNMSFPLSNDTFIPSAIAFGIIIALWWIYFDCGFGFSTNLSHNMLKTFIFGYGQFFVFLALSAIDISLEYGLHFALNPEHSELVNVKAIENMLLAGVAGFLLIMSAIQIIISQKNPRKIYLFRLACGVAVGLGLFTKFNLAFQTIMLIVLTVLILVAINDTYHWENLKNNSQLSK
ncbi:low temperature requirement protein A [Pleurocapsales cyanobacterium LEGE 10410]|nr:low temperature requirement protein A [Pleurocapsales cyanobacterium LEGE 10410]